jgi:3-dehydroquinate synthase
MMADLQPNLYETERRRFPDFGHTFSSAIEEASDYEVTHGEAVAVDMLLTTMIAVRRKLCGEPVLERLVALYRSLGMLKLSERFGPEVLGPALHSARLRRGGRIHMVIPTRIGAGAFLDEVTAEEACLALETAARLCGASVGAYAGVGH